MNKNNRLIPNYIDYFYKYKYLWDVGGKSWGSSLQEGVSHIYTLRLG